MVKWWRKELGRDEALTIIVRLLTVTLAAIVLIGGLNMAMTWWQKQWKNNRERDNLEIAAARTSNPAEVMQGLRGIKPRPRGQPPLTGDYHTLLKNGNVGRSVNLELLPDRLVSILNVQGPDEYAQVMTITLDFPQSSESAGLNVPTAALPFVPVADGATAQIEFGNGGVQSVAFVDFGRGVSFAVPASFIRVSATRAGKPGALVNLRVGAHISYLPLAPSSIARPPSMTQRRLATGGAFDITPPPFASELQVNPVEPGAAGLLTGSIIVEFFARNGTKLGAQQFDAQSIRRAALPGECTRVRISNFLNVAILDWSFQWFLAF